MNCFGINTHVNRPIAFSNRRLWVVLDARDSVTNDQDFVGEEIEPVCEEKHNANNLLDKVANSCVDRKCDAPLFLCGISATGGLGGGEIGGREGGGVCGGGKGGGAGFGDGGGGVGGGVGDGEDGGTFGVGGGESGGTDGGGEEGGGEGGADGGCAGGGVDGLRSEHGS